MLGRRLREYLGVEDRPLCLAYRREAIDIRKRFNRSGFVKERAREKVFGDRAELEG